MIHEALQLIRPGAQYIAQGDTYAGLVWLDEVQPKPTEEEFDVAVAEANRQAPILAEIARLEKLITPRRVREALLTEEGKDFVAGIEAQITAQREAL